MARAFTTCPKTAICCTTGIPSENTAYHAYIGVHHLCTLGTTASCYGGYVPSAPENTQSSRLPESSGDSEAFVSASEQSAGQTAAPTPAVDLLCEAEDAELTGLRRYARTADGRFATAGDVGYVGLWGEDGCAFTFHIEVPVSGTYALAGQHASDLGVNSPEVRAVYGLTGKYLAIMGFDLMDYSPSRVEHGQKPSRSTTRWNGAGWAASSR